MDGPAYDLLGRSPAMARVRLFIERAAAVDAPVLLTGETGTGKSVVARLVHAASRRSHRPFVALNCAAIPEGLFESELFGHRKGAFTGATASRDGMFVCADGGSILLDEVGELPLERQAKMLTVLEDGEVRAVGEERSRSVDVRLMAATVLDLGRAIAEGRFRLDLYHRLALLRLSLPPLRERGEDVHVLARRFLRRSVSRHRLGEACFSDDGKRFLAEYPWPGNVRELAHAVEAALILGEGGSVGREALEAVVVDGAAGARERSG